MDVTHGLLDGLLDRSIINERHVDAIKVSAIVLHDNKCPLLPNRSLHTT